MLPEHLLLHLNEKIPCRKQQIEHTAALLYPSAPSLPAIIIYGPHSTGKNLTVTSTLNALETPHAIIKSRECVTGRHLLERTVLSVRSAAESLGHTIPPSLPPRCENLSALAVSLQLLLSPLPKFILVFSGLDRQREAPPTLAQALARLGETIPNLSVVFLLTHPRPRHLSLTGVPNIHFPPYTRAETLEILSVSPLPIFGADALADADAQRVRECAEDDAWLWPRFCGAVYDSLGRAVAREVPALRTLCESLWPRFVAHVRDGSYGTRDFARLMVRTRSLFQSEESLRATLDGSGGGGGFGAVATTTSTDTDLNDLASTSISIGIGIGSGSAAAAKSKSEPKPAAGAGRRSAHAHAHTHAHASLSYYSKFLLIAAYLASYNPARSDQTYFSKSSEAGKKRRARGQRRGRGRPPSAAAATTPQTTPSKSGRAPRSNPGTPAKFNTPSKPLTSHSAAKPRRIARKLLGPQPFALERWLAVFHAIVPHAAPAGSADLLTQVATLVSLKLVLWVGGGFGGGDVTDPAARFRVNVGWEYVKGLGRGVRVEVEDWVDE